MVFNRSIEELLSAFVEADGRTIELTGLLPANPIGRTLE